MDRLVCEPNPIGEKNARKRVLSFILPYNYVFRTYISIGWTDWKKSKEEIIFNALNAYITNIEFKKLYNYDNIMKINIIIFIFCLLFQI